MEAKRKAIYIHGLGGSGNGSSAQNVKKCLKMSGLANMNFLPILTTS